MNYVAPLSAKEDVWKAVNDQLIRRRRNRFVGIGIGAVVVAALTVPTAAAAIGAFASPTDRRLDAVLGTGNHPPAAQIQTQAQLDKLANEITRRFDGIDSGSQSEAPGFQRVVVNASRQRTGIDVYWAGKVPSALNSFVALHKDVRISVHSVPFSNIQLHNAARSISAFAKSEEFKTTFGRILWITFDDGRPKVAIAAANKSVTPAEVVAALQPIAGMPLTALVQAPGKHNLEFVAQ